MICRTCCEEIDEMLGEDCKCCASKHKFAAFGESCGLTRFVDPDGERYVYFAADLTCAGKKVEVTDFMDELWNALATAKGRSDLLVRRRT